MKEKINNKKNTIQLRRLIAILAVMPFIAIYLMIYPTYSKSYSKEISKSYSIFINSYPKNNKIENSISLIWGEPSYKNVNYVLMRDGQYFTKFNYGTNSYVDTNLIPNTQYTYQIYVENNNNTILSKSNILTLSTENSLYNPLVIVPHSRYTTYSAFGDSITQGFEAPISYYDRISQYLKNKENTTSFNEGIGGNTTYDLLSRINSDLQVENPDLVTIMIGANDIREGSQNNPTITSLDYKNNLLKIITDTNPSPKRTVLIFELSNIIDWNSPGFTAGNAGRLIEFNKIIKGVANSMGIPYISLSGFKSIPNDLTSEGLHPNDIGDKYIYEQLKSKILKYNN